MVDYCHLAYLIQWNEREKTTEDALETLESRNNISCNIDVGILTSAPLIDTTVLFSDKEKWSKDGASAKENSIHDRIVTVPTVNNGWQRPVPPGLAGIHRFETKAKRLAFMRFNVLIWCSHEVTAREKDEGKEALTMYNRNDDNNDDG
ncbi:unnamed protein product [Cercopithifilaria johnstoni]|uniref:Uncharacterized protein n=1 Tax=Cercopithifilaria johnstoni TaxID=2874296 RepID=A0A8J2LY95_9BILA|nr:unnamed protein product [Cercopithifilaria johnstoni]